MGIVIAVVFFIFTPQHGSEIKAGSMVPEFTLPDQNGKDFNIKDVVGTKNLVIYFYPKDDTP